MVHSKRQRNAAIMNFLPNKKIILVGQENVLLILHNKIRPCSGLTLTLWPAVRPCPQNAVPCEGRRHQSHSRQQGGEASPASVCRAAAAHVSQAPAANAAQASSVLTLSFCVLARAARIYTFA